MTYEQKNKKRKGGRRENTRIGFCSRGQPCSNIFYFFSWLPYLLFPIFLCFPFHHFIPFNFYFFGFYLAAYEKGKNKIIKKDKEGEHLFSFIHTFYLFYFFYVCARFREVIDVGVQRVPQYMKDFSVEIYYIGTIRTLGSISCVKR